MKRILTLLFSAFCLSMTYAADITTAQAGEWSDVATWTGGVIPTVADNVTINHAVNVNSTVDATATDPGTSYLGNCNNLTINSTFTLNGSFNVIGLTTISSTGSLLAGTVASVFFRTTGGITQNGTINMHNATGSAVFFFQGPTSVTFTIDASSVSTNLRGSTGASTTQGITCNKDQTTTTTEVAVDFVVNKAFTTGSAASSATAAFLTITKGTFRIMGNATVSSNTISITSTQTFSIPSTLSNFGGLTLDNPNYTVLGINGGTGTGSSCSINGIIRLKQGSFNFGIPASTTSNYFLAFNQSTADRARLIIEGGSHSIVRLVSASTANQFNFEMSDGTLTVGNTGSNTPSTPYFGSSTTSAATPSKLNISGGTLILWRGGSNLAYRLPQANVASLSITGGTVQCGTTGSNTTNIIGLEGPLPNVTTNTSGMTARINTTASTIYGNLTVATGTTFTTNLAGFTMSGNSAAQPGNIINDGTLTLNSSASAVLTFNGTFGAQNITNNGTITSNQTMSITVNKTSGTNTVTVPSTLAFMSSATLTLTAGVFDGGVIGTGGATGNNLVLTNGSLGATTTYNIGTGTSSINYNGTSAQITGSETTNMYNASGAFNITVNNANGVTLGASAIMNSLTLTAGKVTLDDKNLTIKSGGSINSATLAKYIVTNGTGKLTRLQTGVAATAFPIGTAAAYAPITITNSGTNDDFSASVSNSTTNMADPEKAIKLTWDISEGTAGGTTATLALQAPATTFGTSFSATGVNTIGHWNGTTWDHVTATNSGTDPYTATIMGYTGGFSPFAVGGANALSAELKTIKATPLSNSNRLDWSTASEQNMTNYQIERSATGKTDWETIGSVAAKGSNSNYTFEDKTPLSISYYRISMVENTGKVAYSKVVNAVQKVKTIKVISIAPNPTSAEMTINFAAAKNGKAIVTVIDILGRVAMTQNVGTTEGGNTVQLNLANLPNGTYTLTINDGDNTVIQRIAKQ
jgi:hypothetical protein